MAVIISNALLLGFERFDADAQLRKALVTGNYVLTGLFALEMMIRIMAFEKSFWVGASIPTPSENPYYVNWIETGILLISVADVIGQVSSIVLVWVSLLCGAALFWFGSHYCALSRDMVTYKKLCRQRADPPCMLHSILFDLFGPFVFYELSVYRDIGLPSSTA